MIQTQAFIHDVEQWLAGREVDAAIKELQDKYSKFKMLESRLQQRRVRLMAKLPEIRKALDMVELLIAKRGTGETVVADFELTDNVFAKATLKDTSSVSLWLGANVMLQYTLEEAKALLSQNHSNCQQNLETLKSELAVIRDNVTILEVSIARVYNHDISKRRGQKKGGEETT